MAMTTAEPSRATPPNSRPPSTQPVGRSSTTPSPNTTTSSNPFRRSTALTSTFTRTTSSFTVTTQSSLPSMTSRYTSAPLTGTAGGRLLKLLGDCFLLVGLYADAIRCFDDGAERCRVGGDVLWEAAAREGRAVAGIGEAWDGRDGSVRRRRLQLVWSQIDRRTCLSHSQRRLFLPRFSLTTSRLLRASRALHYLTLRYFCPLPHKILRAR